MIHLAVFSQEVSVIAIFVHCFNSYGDRFSPPPYTRIRRVIYLPKKDKTQSTEKDTFVFVLFVFFQNFYKYSNHIEL